MAAFSFEKISGPELDDLIVRDREEHFRFRQQWFNRFGLLVSVTLLTGLAIIATALVLHLK